MTDATTNQNLSFQQRRWRVHLWLIIAFLVSLVTLLLHLSLGMHELIGLAFATLVVVHLRQRRKRVRGLLVQLRKVRSLARPIGRLAWSDLILSFLIFNLIVSGIADYLVGGRRIFITIGLPRALRWHALLAVLVLGYLLVHVLRRASRMRASEVR